MIFGIIYLESRNYFKGLTKNILIPKTWFCLFMYSLVSYIFAQTPNVLERQDKDLLCYMWTANNLMQKEIFTADKTKKLAKLLEKKFYKLNGKLVNWGDDGSLGGMIASSTKMIVEMFNFAGFKLDTFVKTGDAITYQPGVKGDDDNYVTKLFKKPKSTDYISQEDALEIMGQSNFQGWLIKLNYYSEASGWEHYTTITRNDDNWYYLDPGFPIIDPTKPLESYGCTRYDGYSVDIQGPKRILRDAPAVDGTPKWRKIDCRRLRRYGATAVNYMASKYLGIYFINIYKLNIFFIYL